MQLRMVRLEPGSLHEACAASAPGGRVLWCWHGSASGALLSLPAGLQSLWTCEQSGPVLDTALGMAEIDNQSLFWSGESPLRGYLRTDAAVTVLAWRPTILEPGERRAQLFPSRQALSRPLLRAVRRLVQAGTALPAQHWSQPLLFHAMLDALRQQQAGFTPLVARCPGRSLQTREQVFSRLLRVRTLVEWASQPDFDIESMARVASYSRFHFIRMFREVFAETPNDFLLRIRLQKADELLRRTDLSVSEISLRMGFSGGASFARAFRRQFGTTATHVKRAVATR